MFQFGGLKSGKGKEDPQVINVDDDESEENVTNDRPERSISLFTDGENVTLDNIDEYFQNIKGYDRDEIRNIINKKYELQQQFVNKQYALHLKEESEKEKRIEKMREDEIMRKQMDYYNPEMKGEFEEAYNFIKTCTKRQYENCEKNYNNAIEFSDYQAVLKNRWIGDEIINGFMDLLKSDRVGSFNSFFFEKYSKSSYKSVKSWADKIKFFSHEIVLVPINLSNTHWILGFFNNKEQTVSVLDSLGSHRKYELNKLIEFGNEYARDNDKNFIYEEKTFANLPRQDNGFDCGAFTCKYADCLSLQIPFKFSQDDIPYFRKCLATQVLVKKLIIPRDE